MTEYHVISELLPDVVSKAHHQMLDMFSLTLHNYNDLEWLQLFPGFLGVFSQNIDPALLWPSESAGKYDGPTTTMRAGAAVPMYQLHLWMVRNFLDAKTKTTGTKDLKNSETAIIWIPNWQSQNGSSERTSVIYRYTIQIHIGSHGHMVTWS